MTCLRSGPLGGDQQIGARIAEGDVDMLIFFWDPLEPHPHDPDVKALLRLAVAWNIPVACNRASADFMISSPLFARRYDRLQPDFADYATQGLGRDRGIGRPGRLNRVCFAREVSAGDLLLHLSRARRAPAGLRP